MKRYRVLKMDYDSRAIVLNLEINDAWESKVRDQWAATKKQMSDGILAEYGPLDGFRKIEDFKEMGTAPFSVVAFHNKFFRQIREAFTIGAYYSALTGAE